MTEMVKVKAVAGRDTLMEDGREWPQGSVLVEKTHYIRRRLADGDIQEAVSGGTPRTGNEKNQEVGGKKSVSEPSSPSSKGDK